MKTETVTEALAFLSVLEWIETGEEVHVVREGRPVAVISPAPRPVKHPDYLARRKQTSGEKVLSAEASAAIRDSTPAFTGPAAVQATGFRDLAPEVATVDRR